MAGRTIRVFDMTRDGFPFLAMGFTGAKADRVVANSRDVAAYFEKRHDDVLRRIYGLDCSPEFTARNFAASTYTDPTGRSLPMYEMTRSGFVFLAMGFTGAKADRVVASSRDVAAYFGKEHKHVLRDIDAIAERLPEFGQSNFGPTSYTDGWNREQRAIDMTRDHTNIPP